MTRCTVALVVLVLVLAASSAHATNQLGKRITIYWWMPAINGEMSVFDSTVSIDAGFSELSDYLNAGINLDAEYWPARWGLYFTSNYVALEDESITENHTDVTLARAVDMLYFDFGLGYQFGPYPFGSEPGGPSLGVDVLAGGRYVWLQNEIHYKAVQRFQESSNFVDPVIGGRLRFYPSRRWALNMRGDIGGGAGADLMWNLVLGAHWEFANHWWLNFAYKWLDIDYTPSGSDDEICLDARTHGPALGLSITW